MVSAMSPSATAQFLLTSNTSHAINSYLRSRSRSPTRNSRLARSSKEVCRQCGLDMFFAGLLVNPDDLRWLGGIEGLDLLRGLDVFAAQDEVVLAAQLAANFFDRRAHLAGVFFAAEINRRLVAEWAFVQTDLQARRGFHGCHKCTSRGVRVSGFEMRTN